MKRIFALLAVLFMLAVPASAQVQYGTGYASKLQFGPSGPRVSFYAGSPETHVTGAVGDLCIDSTTGTIYRKASGAGTNTGWAKYPQLAGGNAWSGLQTIDGGLHVGGTSDPGDNDLLVDGEARFGTGNDIAILSTESASYRLWVGAADPTTPAPFRVEKDGTFRAGAAQLIGNSYTAGWAGSGYRLDYGLTTAATSYLELDRLKVRGKMDVYELLVHQIRATNGSIFVANTGKAKTVTDNGGGSYTIETETDHGFLADDLIRAQRFTGTGVYQSDLTVASVADTTHFTATLRATYDAPAAGMEFVRLGNTSDATRRGSILLTADETNAPLVDVFADVDAFGDWGAAANRRVRIGNLNGSYGYVADTWGLAAGHSAGKHLTVESSNGIRMMDGATTRMLLAGDNLTIYSASDATTYAQMGATAFKLVAHGTEKVSINSDGTATFAGQVTASSGAIGGWTIGADSLTGGNAGLYSAGFLKLGTGDDVVHVSASNATYRLWAGKDDESTAPFSVTKAGALKATNATITGTVNATDGYFGTGSTKVAINDDGLDVGTAGRILGGQTAYNTGTGFFLGYSGGAYKFSVGHDDGNRLTYDATNLKLVSQHLTIDDNGVTLTASSSVDTKRAYRWDDGYGGTYYTSSGHMYWQATDDFQMLQVDAGGTNWGWIFTGNGGDSTVLIPYLLAGSTASIGNSTYPFDDFYGRTYHAAGNTGVSDTCGAGVGALTITGGIVTSMTCASPAPVADLTSLRHDNAALREALAALTTKVAALETQLGAK